jgi:hypothetical protein
MAFTFLESPLAAAVPPYLALALGIRNARKPAEGCTLHSQSRWCNGNLPTGYFPWSGIGSIVGLRLRAG